MALAAAALALTCGSAVVQRVGPTQRVEGEGFCPGREPCRVAALGAGFPLPFLVDDPQVSVPNAIGLFEDDFRPVAFAANLSLYLGLCALAARAWTRRRGPGAPGQSPTPPPPTGTPDRP